MSLEDKATLIGTAGLLILIFSWLACYPVGHL